MGEDRREKDGSPEFQDKLSELVRAGAQQMIGILRFTQRCRWGVARE